MFTPSVNAADVTWLNDSACAGLDVDDFFVDAGHVISEEVLEICRTCPVRRECGTQAYLRDIGNGYFAGISPGRRDKVKSLAEIHALIDADPPSTQDFVTNEDDALVAATIPATILARLRGFLAKSALSSKGEDQLEYRLKAEELAQDHGVDLLELEALGVV